MRQRLAFALIALLFLGLLALRAWRSVAPREEGHGHAPGAHGGIIIPVAGDRYHVEAVFTRDGWLKIYTLGRDEGRVMEVPVQVLTAHVTPEGDSDAITVRLTPEPQPGDALGRTSCFAGKLPAGLEGRGLAVVVPSVRVEGERYRLAFSRTAAVPTMPASVGGDEERELFLTPAGAYTAADIEANGKTTPSRKFRGFQARHDHDPRPGDRLCPVTRTKANHACTWTVGGKEYQFCCPPCIAEFVRLARERPDRIEPPGAYVKR